VNKKIKSLGELILHAGKQNSKVECVDKRNRGRFNNLAKGVEKGGLGRG
jgi:hypothetical protein